VSTVPRSPATQARRELGLRLRRIRKTAGLTGQMLADATGQHFTRISRIENGIQPPTDRNIQDWCTACGAKDQIPDLIATAQVVESAYLDWARQSRAGLKHLGTLHSIATYRRTDVVLGEQALHTRYGSLADCVDVAADARQVQSLLVPTGLVDLAPPR
jgi:transcriptional regulator with XRE-family HTH domain